MLSFEFVQLGRAEADGQSAEMKRCVMIKSIKYDYIIVANYDTLISKQHQPLKLYLHRCHIIPKLIISLAPYHQYRTMPPKVASFEQEKCVLWRFLNFKVERMQLWVESMLK
jgi:hypothetical protein